jgi:signal transduction histidine kinase
MEISVSYQLLQAASSLALGAAAGFLYDIFRVVRRRARSIAVTTITDILFWLITGAALFLMGLSLGQGRQRLFMIVMAFLGATAYFVVLSPLSLIVCNALADGFLFLLYCLSRPVVWGYRLFKKIHTFIKNIFLYSMKCYTIRRDNIQSAKRAARLRRRAMSPKKEDVHEEENEEKNGYYYEARDSRVNRVRGDGPSRHALQNRGRGSIQKVSRRSGRGKENRHGRSPVQNRP